MRRLDRAVSRALPVAGALVCVGAWPAHAHSGFVGMSDFWNGFLHLVLAPEQCISLLALGLVMARLETDKIEAPFHLYLMAFAAGLVLGVAVFPPEIEAMRSIPLLAAGLLLVDPGDRVQRMPRAAMIAASAAAGLSFGSSVPAEVSRLVFAGGMFLGAILFPTYAMVVWEKVYVPWFRIAVRIAGSWLAAVGIMLFGVSIR